MASLRSAMGTIERRLSLTFARKLWCLKISKVKMNSSVRGNNGHKAAFFGYTPVNEEEKQNLVYNVFRNVAENYDLMNDAMSLGVHKLWKDNFVRLLHPTSGMHVLDAAGGTADIALRILARSSVNGPSGPCQITITDINDAMLRVGMRKAGQAATASNCHLHWCRSDAERLPFKENTFDAYTIAFGIRNCTHLEKVLSEAYRVLKPGGRFMCLEFSRVTNDPLRRFYDWYSFNIIPVLGRLIANDWQSYQYLVESIRKFPSQEAFASTIRAAQFTNVSWTNMSCGIVSIHSGYKLVH